jgi:transcriptional regulator with XRE-family HTH domain
MIGRKIKVLREQRGMTQHELAHKTGFKQSQISKVERGKRHLVDYEIPIVARALGVSVVDLLDEEQQSA